MKKLIAFIFLSLIAFSSFAQTKINPAKLLQGTSGAGTLFLSSDNSGNVSFSNNLNGGVISGSANASLSGDLLPFGQASAMYMLKNGMPNNGNDIMNARIIRNINSSVNNDGLYLGYGNSNSANTWIFGGGATTGGIKILGSGVNDVTIAGSIAFHLGNYQSFLNSVYLGIGGTAANATLLNSQNAAYYLNYSNLTNKPTSLSQFTNDLSALYSSTNIERVKVTNAEMQIKAVGATLTDEFALQWGDASTFILGSGLNDYLRFFTNNIERFRIIQNGNVIVGASTGSEKFNVVGTSYFSARANFGASIAMSNDYDLNWGDGSTFISANATSDYLRFYNNNTLKLDIRDTMSVFNHKVQVGTPTAANHAITWAFGDTRYLGIAATAANSLLFKGLDTTTFAREDAVNTFTQRNNFTNFVNIAGPSAIAAAAHTNYTDAADRIYTMQGDGDVRSITYQGLLNANQANDTFAMSSAAQTFNLSSNLVNTIDVSMHAASFDSLDIRLPAIQFDDNQTITITTSNKRMILGQGDKIKITSSTGTTLLEVVNDPNSLLTSKYEINTATLGYIAMQIQYSKKRNLWRLISFENSIDQ